MQAPPSHLYYVHWIYRSCSYSETSPIGLQYYHGPGSLDIISCYLTVLWPRPSHRSSDSQQRWHDVMMSWCDCHVIWHDHIEEAGLLKYILSLPSHHCLWWLQCICFVWSSPGSRHRTLLSPKYTSLWSGSVVASYSPTPGHSQPANCQPRVPVDHSALCPAAAISHPKKPLLLPPPPFSNQQSGVRTVVRCINSAQADLARWTDPWNFTFLAQRSVKNVKSLSKRAKDLN